MATTRQIERYDIVELLEPVDAAPAGARGGVLEFLGDDRSIAEIEILEPKLDGLDNIVYATLDKLRVVEPHPAFRRRLGGTNLKLQRPFRREHLRTSARSA